MTPLYRGFLLGATAAAACLIAAASERAASAAARQPSAPPVGQHVFARWCASCHEDSVRAPGTSALAAKYGKDLAAPLEQRQNLTPELVRFFVRNGVSVMPSFRKTEISDAELAALGQYLSPAAAQRRRASAK